MTKIATKITAETPNIRAEILRVAEQCDRHLAGGAPVLDRDFLLRIAAELLEVKSPDASCCAAVILKRTARFDPKYRELIRDCAGALRFIANWQPGAP